MFNPPAETFTYIDKSMFEGGYIFTGSKDAGAMAERLRWLSSYSGLGTARTNSKEQSTSKLRVL
jgi:hypothetical protein